MSEAKKSDNSTTETSKQIQETSLVAIECKSTLNKLPFSSILQNLLEEHKVQSLIVESLKEEIFYLEQNPLLYFENRKRFLYHAYTQTLAECQTKMKFDVKVVLNSFKLIDSSMLVTPSQIEKSD